MSRVKICGLRRPQDIAWANQLLPDYVGFIFAPSKRRVTVQEARQLKAALDPRIQAVGVFVNEELPVITGLCREGVIDLIQLHGDETEAFLLELKQQVTQPVIRAVRVGASLPPLPSGADYLLFDTLAGPVYGGTGTTFRWSLITDVKIPYFLAGGIGPENAGTAINQLSPFCVDASSSLEVNGWKDYAKMQRLVYAVRAATGNAGLD